MDGECQAEIESGQLFLKRDDDIVRPFAGLSSRVGQPDAESLHPGDLCSALESLFLVDSLTGHQSKQSMCHVEVVGTTAKPRKEFLAAMAPMGYTQSDCRYRRASMWVEFLSSFSPREYCSTAFGILGS